MRFLHCVSVIVFNISFLINGAVLPNNDLFKLDIVHYNDFHDRFEETSVEYSVCQTNDTKCLGGFARLYQEIKTLLLEKPDALVLDVGDTFQGTYWYTLLKWNVTQHFINMIPNDAHAIGNHEFDDGVAGLAPYLAALHAPALAANIDTRDEPLLNGLYKPHVIIERRGRKIGIIGLITVDTMVLSKPGGVIFLDPVETTKQEAQLLTEQGVDIIIVLSHCGFPVDKEIARRVGENIDIIVGGHSHTLLWNGTSPSNETVSGPYPFMVETESNPEHKVLIVTASAYSKYLGNLTACFDNQGKLQSFEGEPVFLNRSIPENPEMKALLEPYVTKVHDLVQEVIGSANKPLLMDMCGSHECEIGNFIADAYLNATKEEITTNLSNAVFFMRNMIRGSLPKGDITRGAVINVSPFANKLVTFALPGRYLLEALDKCMSVWWVQKPFSGPWVPHVAGIKVTLDGNLRRAVSVMVKEDDKYQPLNLDKVYQITTVDFLFLGGNGLTMLKEHGKDLKIIGKEADILENYISKTLPINPTLDNRLTFIN